MSVLQTVQKKTTNNNLHMDRQCKKKTTTTIYIWTDGVVVFFMVIIIDVANSSEATQQLRTAAFNLIQLHIFKLSASRHVPDLTSLTHLKTFA